MEFFVRVYSEVMCRKNKFIPFIEKAVAKGYVDYAGDELDSIIPPTSRRQGAREKNGCIGKNKKYSRCICRYINYIKNI